MPTILDNFIELVSNTDDTSELDQVIREAFVDKIDVFTNFSKNLGIATTKLNTLNQIEWDNFEYNPLEIESLIGESLVSLERCQVYKEQHRALKKEVASIIEKLFRLRQILIKDLVDEKNRLQAKAPDRSIPQINYANRRENLQFIFKSTTASHAEQRHALNLGRSPDNLQQRKDAYNSDRSSNHKKKVKNLILEREHAIGNHKETGTLNSKSAAHGSALAEIHRLRSEEVTNASIIQSLEHKIKKEKQLFSLVVATYAEGGALDIGEQWDLLVNYYQRDYVSALKRCAALKIGWERLFAENKDFLIQRDASLQDYLIYLRDLKDQFEAKMQRYNRSFLTFSLGDLAPDEPERLGDSFTFEVQHPKSPLIGDAQILCRSVQLICSNEADKITMSLIHPTVIEGYPSRPVYLTAMPKAAMIAQSENATPLVNVPLEDIWEISVHGEGWRDCFLQYRVIIG